MWEKILGQDAKHPQLPQGDQPFSFPCPDIYPTPPAKTSTVLMQQLEFCGRSWRQINLQDRGNAVPLALVSAVLG